MAEADPIVVVLAGGSGTRFWPLSRKDRPKQYLELFGKRSLIQQTVDRILPLVPAERVFICSAQSQAALVKEQLPEIKNHLFEPQGKNTAAALMLTTVELLRQGWHLDTPMIVLPADHFIRNPTRFREVLEKGLEFARQSHGLVTLGITPLTAHTGYGYIETMESATETRDGILKVRRFLEKPDRATAESFVRLGNYYWNSGIFLWTLSSLSSAFQRWMPEEWYRIAHYRGPDELKKIYAELDSTPVDIGVLEKAANVFVIPCAEIGWSDVGSWDALYQLHRSEDGNVELGGEVHPIESRGCLVKAPDGKKVALVGVEDLIIVENGDTLLIAHRSKDQWVRQAARELDEEKA